MMYHCLPLSEACVMKLICPQGYSMPSYAACSGDSGKKEEVVKAWDAGKIVLPSDGIPGQSGQLSSAASNHKEWLRTATETYEIEYEEVSLSFPVAVLWQSCIAFGPLGLEAAYSNYSNPA